MALGTSIPDFAPQITTTGATRAFWSAKLAPFQTGNKIFVSSVGAATLYGVAPPGRNDGTRCFRITGDGSTVTFTLPTAATGVTYPTTIAASLTAANYLQAIVLANVAYVSTFGGLVTNYPNATLRERVGSDAVPSGTQYLINGTTVTFGTAPALGAVYEIMVPDPATITQLTGGALTANKRYTVSTYEFLTCGVAAVDVASIQRW